MRLRNKKTGKRGCIAEFNNYFIVVYPVNEKWNAYNDEKYVYYSVSEFCEDWEDAKEPLIKDPKIRKAVRAWAEANGYSLVKIGYDMASEPNNGNVQIHFEGSDIVDEDKYGVHALAELCGEEEE